MEKLLNAGDQNNEMLSGEFIDFAGDRYYVIRNVDKMPPFFISIISNVDHWLFISSTGGLTAGRVSPETALFPYITVDRIHESSPHTGSKTMLRVAANGKKQNWDPFNREHDGRYSISRNLYKNRLGNKLCFEEINRDLHLAYRYTWATSDSYGFVRQCELQNLGDKDARVDLVDGLQNVLPAGTPRFAQSNTSNLVDAYKWSELDAQSGLALFALYSGITDRAEPCESLKANTVFCLGLDEPQVLISSEQLSKFHLGANLEPEVHKRGVRGAYLVNQALELAPQASQRWMIVADIEKTQADVVDLHNRLTNPTELGEAITRSIDTGTDELARIMAGGDGFQATAEENVTVHHYANVLFNILRGGIFDDQYNVSSRDFSATVRNFNQGVFERNRDLLEALPKRLTFAGLLSDIRSHADPQLERLAYEYLPITFGRRHGDPSRPWNQFAINLKDEQGNGLLSYQGNWRDIFQNWEALIVSYPDFVENVIAKFVNASTMDGYNPYRITKEGIDWEVEEPDDPWSYIGYWGDHQIIYLQKFLELSRDFHPARLRELLRQPIFCYANVPYRIKLFDALLEDPKSTVTYDDALAERIEHRVAAMGADGKLVLDASGEVYQVNLLEKLLVPLLCKLGNLVIDGGIWMNTQRPEWNDANNALVGQGLSMVTLYYMRRYVRFLQRLLANESESFDLSSEVSQWLTETTAALSNVRPLLDDGPVTAKQRYQSLTELGLAASRYREVVYEQESFSGKVAQTLDPVRIMLDDALATIDHSIATNKRADGMYHAYNLLDLRQESVAIDTLYPMLEGQVAALSAGAVSPEDAVAVLEALFESDVYRPDQHSFMLYPDRALPGFLDKNRISDEQVQTIPLLQEMLSAGDEHVVVRDADGCYRFNADFTNVGDLKDQLDALAPVYSDELEAAREPLEELFETVFQHKAFTGRSGTMFSFEGLGSIYWHMVSKLMLAVLENYFAALSQGADDPVCQRLGQLYYRIREGIGFNKTPAEYGAVPTDPYSHTPKHSGARQPGMTGQVKEEILCRFGELGVRVSDGAVRFQPDLLRAREFMTESRDTGYVDVDDNWQTIAVPRNGLVFTWCQVPVIYKLDDDADPSLTITWNSGKTKTLPHLALSAEQSAELFQRSGRIRQLNINLRANMLFAE
ncbi:MAG: hypothetical protein ACR2QI_08180 [Woeseiaceae bacterium]